MTGGGDTARGIAADVDPKRGYEFWYFGDGNMYNAPTGAIVGDAWSENFRVYWDGDIYDELLNGVGGGHSQPYLEKAGEGRMLVDGKNLFEYAYSVTCNGTKTTPCLSADIFGDWREEMIFFNNEDKATLNIFSTSHETAARVPCLLYDHVYRLGIAWQNVGYNQPPHLGYYLPDATAARFKMEQTEPLTLHYNNCTGATLVSAVLMDGTEVSADDFTLTQDEKLCNLTIATKTAVKDISHLVLQPISPSNGLKNTVNVYASGTAPTGMEEIANSQHSIANSQYYDLQGRRVKTPALSGIYVTKGKKVIIK
jgi:rhamnogalacturonan endolyase